MLDLKSVVSGLCCGLLIGLLISNYQGDTEVQIANHGIYMYTNGCQHNTAKS
jgi:hypothetical protein